MEESQETIEVKSRFYTINGMRPVVKHLSRAITLDEYHKPTYDIHKNICDAYYKGNLPEPKLLKRIICRACGITMEQIDQRNRKREIVIARQIGMMYMALHKGVKEYNISLAKIGAMYGGKDHATVLHATRTIKQLVESKDEYVTECFDLFKKGLSEVHTSYVTDKIKSIKPIKKH